MTGAGYGADDKLPVTGGLMTGTLTLDGTPPLRIPGGASAGYVAVSDAYGNVAWSPSAQVVHQDVQAATVAALPANTYANGTLGVGATLTGNSVGTLTVDGHPVVLGDRVLVQDEVAATHNGIYLCTTAGDSGTQYVLTRATDMDQAAEVPSAFCYVQNGTANGGGGFVVIPGGPYTMGSTAINWAQFSASASGGGGSVNSVSAGDASVTVSGTTAVTVEAGTLDQVANLHPPAADWSNNSKKITSLANGASAQDAATFGQLPSSGTPLPLGSGGTGVSAASNAALLTGLGALSSSSNLSDVASASTARANLGLGTAATLAASAVAQTASNLSDLASAPTARTNLGLGSAATLASTAVAQTANNLSDLGSAATARTNLGLGSAATLASSAVAQTASNLSDLASASAARTNLGLGTAAVASSGTFAQVANNLSDVSSASTSRSNLGALAANQLSPADHSLIAWNFPPYNVRSSDHPAMTAGTLYVAKIPVPYAATISKVGYYVAQASATPTASQCFAALFGPTGTLLAATADQASNFGATGTYLVSLTSGQAVSAGYVYAGFYFNGTGAALGLGVGNATSAVLNFNLTNSTSLWATANTGLTTAMPGSLGTLTSVTDGIWACVA